MVQRAHRIFVTEVFETRYTYAISLEASLSGTKGCLLLNRTVSSNPVHANSKTSCRRHSIFQSIQIIIFASSSLASLFSNPVYQSFSLIKRAIELRINIVHFHAVYKKSESFCELRPVQLPPGKERNLYRIVRHESRLYKVFLIFEF